MILMDDFLIMLRLVGVSVVCVWVCLKVVCFWMGKLWFSLCVLIRFIGFFFWGVRGLWLCCVVDFV